MFSGPRRFSSCHANLAQRRRPTGVDQSDTVGVNFCERWFTCLVETLHKSPHMGNSRPIIGIVPVRLLAAHETPRCKWCGPLPWPNAVREAADSTDSYTVSLIGLVPGANALQRDCRLPSCKSAWRNVCLVSMRWLDPGVFKTSELVNLRVPSCQVPPVVGNPGSCDGRSG